MPVLTEYMMRRLISVSDLSELNFMKTRREVTRLPFVSCPHFVKEIGERCGSEYIGRDT